MLQFNDDCNEAANECPNYSNYWLVDDRVILLGEITPKKLVKNWLSCNTLWDGGYKRCLSTAAKKVFKKYKIYRLTKKLNKRA